ncbi:MAG: P-II family nitrogen regulator [Oscillospiraceae bacterium]|nr:P-II family nitrogen regulator [Oscillospiraceae bacterium]
MKELVIIIKPEHIQTLKQILTGDRVYGMTVSSVMGCGSQKAAKGAEVVVNFMPRIRVETVVADAAVEGIVEQVREKLSTGTPGDGVIFVRGVDEAIRIRNGERGEKVL